MPKKRHIPSYCFHKPSGRAYVRVRGQFIYLGAYDSPESKEAYARVLAELATSPERTPSPATPAGITVTELIAAYWEFAESYYQKRGRPTRHLDGIRIALRRLKSLYGQVPAADFSPKALKALRQTIIADGCCRSYVNKQVELIRQVFKWGVSEELMPVAVHQALTTVAGLRKGRSSARETAPIGPVADEVIDATLPHLPAVVSDMVRLQRFCGCRPGEVCQMRPCDIDTSGDVWVYRPESHKTEHHERERIIYIGPRGQEVLRPYLMREEAAYCFSPAESRERHLAVIRANRKTKVQPSQVNRRKNRPKRRAGTFYKKDAYGNAIRRAIEKGNRERVKEAEEMGIKPMLLPHWHPNQLRHTAATEIRKLFGLEASQTVLGHAKADVTQVYAERDSALAVEVARKIG